MMDPTLVSFAAIISPVIAALFAAYTLAMKQARDDWKELFKQEREDHKATRLLVSAESGKNAQSINQLAEFIQELPRRREDWSQLGERRR